VFDNAVLKETFGPKKNEVSNLEYYVTRSFIICLSHLVLLEWWNL